MYLAGDLWIKTTVKENYCKKWGLGVKIKDIEKIGKIRDREKTFRNIQETDGKNINFKLVLLHKETSGPRDGSN